MPSISVIPSTLQIVRLRGIYNIFKDKLGRFGDICIAGGAVRDSLLGRNPKDYDIFVFPNDFWDSRIGLTREIRQALSGYTTVTPFEQSSTHVVKTINFMTHTVQIIVTNASDVYDLMDTFDWNVCMYAYNGEFHTTDCLDNLEQGSHLSLHRITRAKSTLRRGYRFSDRYGLIFPDDTLFQIMDRIREDARCENETPVLF